MQGNLIKRGKRPQEILGKKYNRPICHLYHENKSYTSMFLVRAWYQSWAVSEDDFNKVEMHKPAQFYVRRDWVGSGILMNSVSRFLKSREKNSCWYIYKCLRPIIHYTMYSIHIIYLSIVRNPFLPLLWTTRWFCTAIGANLSYSCIVVLDEIMYGRYRYFPASHISKSRGLKEKVKKMSKLHTRFRWVSGCLISHPFTNRNLLF